MMRVAARGRTRDRRIAALANQLGAARPLRQLATTVAPAAAAGSHAAAVSLTVESMINFRTNM